MAEASRARTALDAELSAWAHAGRTATLWWRDDDAAVAHSALTQLLELSERYGVPLALAVVPQLANSSLVQAIGAVTNVTPIIHGYAHINHAPPGEKQAEFGAHRDQSIMCSELGDGLSLLRGMFGEKLFPVLAPPWNRLDHGLTAHLPMLGYCGVSMFRPSSSRSPAPGLVQTNCHIDSIDWRTRRGQRAEDAVLEELTTLLRIRRLYPDISSDALALGKPLPQGFDPFEPTGILTHHLVQDAESWEFLTQLFRAIAPHCQPGGGARWLSCAEAFKPGVATAA